MKPYDKQNQARRDYTGQRIRRERVLWGLTQEQLSSMLGISANYLGQIERGNRDLSRKMEDRLCVLFHLDRNELHSPVGSGPNTRVSEATLLYPSLDENEIQRLLSSCTAEELQMCGQVIRSMLIYMRHEDTLTTSGEYWSP